MSIEFFARLPLHGETQYIPGEAFRQDLALNRMKQHQAMADDFSSEAFHPAPSILRKRAVGTIVAILISQMEFA